MTNGINQTMNSISKDLILCFDVETTGLIPKTHDKPYPYITQLSCILYDKPLGKMVNIYNSYIQVPKDVEITQEITDLTGVTREKCDAGIPIVDAMIAFHNAWMICSTFVAHNMEFDYTMLTVEYERNAADLSYRNIPKLFTHPNMWGQWPEKYCTMESTIQICKLPFSNPKRNWGGGAYKFPKLAELYFFLFDETPENLHNSLVDTVVCLKCYLRFRYSIMTKYEIEPTSEDTFRVSLKVVV